MGMYTEILFRAEMVPNWDEDEKVRRAVSIMRNTYTEEPPERELLPDHPLFDCPRWALLATCNSYYFPLANHEVWEDDYQGGKYWSFRANIKNYDGEIGKFFDWIDPYIRDSGGEFVGYELYEEDTTPTLHFKGGPR